MRDEMELRHIIKAAKEEIENLFPDLSLVLILLNRTNGPTPVVVAGNLQGEQESTIRLFRQLADKIEKEGANPVILMPN